MCENCKYKLICLTNPETSNILSLKNCFVVTSKVKPTKAVMFEHVQVNDILIMSLRLQSPGSGGNGLYATQITVHNPRMNITGQFTLGNLAKYLKCFELQRIV